MPRLLLLFAVAIGCATTSFATETMPLGVVFKDEEASLRLRFANLRKDSVSLANAIVSCDCLQPWFAPMPVPAGETVALPFSYVSHQPGRIEISVEFRGPAGEVLQTTHVRGFVADRSWLIPSAKLHASIPAEGIAIVDVRNTKRYLHAHLPRALNIMPFALKARGDLRAQKVVLVDDGYAIDALLEQVSALRALGFKDVVVLEGGVPGWIRAGFAVEGETSSARPIATITPAEFARVSSTAEWKILEVGGEPTSKPLEGGERVGEWAAAMDILRTAQAPTKARLAPNVLIVAAGDASYAWIESRIARSSSAPPVYFLAGGRAALDAYRASQAALALGTHEMVQARPAARSRAAATGGCRSCGK